MGKGQVFAPMEWVKKEFAKLNRNLTTATRGTSTWNTSDTNFAPSKSTIFVDKIDGIPLASITCKAYISVLSANTTMHIATTSIKPRSALKFPMTVVAGTTIYNDSTATLEIATDGKIYVKSSAGVSSGSPRVFELVGETYFTQ